MMILIVCKVVLCMHWESLLAFFHALFLEKYRNGAEENF